jgi:hypothetical protein
LDHWIIEERLKGKGNYELWMPDCQVPSAEAIVSRTREFWRALTAAALTQQRSALLLLHIETVARLDFSLTNIGEDFSDLPGKPDRYRLVIRAECVVVIHLR